MAKISELRKKMDEIHAEIHAEKEAGLIEIGTLYCALEKVNEDEKSAIKNMISERANDLSDLVELSTALKKEVTKLTKRMKSDF